MNLIQDAIDDFLLCLEDDHTELWIIPRYITDWAPDLNISEVAALTKQIVKQLIDEHDVKLIDMITQQITSVTSDEAMRRVDEIFSTLKRRPSVGDGFWMTKE